MHQLTFTPSETLFFRDARPMGGASSGQGARFPQPHVLNSALHAACHRAFAGDAEIGHSHPLKKGKDRQSDRTERFGSLRSAGPFPVDTDKQWYFPRPADLNLPQDGPACCVADSLNFTGSHSLPVGLRPIVPTQQPSKQTFPEWISQSEFEAYLAGEHTNNQGRPSNHFFTAEHSIGIGIEAHSGSVESGKIYSRSQLRFNEGCTLGAYVETDHQHGDEPLIEQLFPEQGIIKIGGEGRTCAVQHQVSQRMDTLPRAAAITGTRVKWVLLSPAVYPAIAPHTGGWLPNWIDQGNYKVQLLDGPGKNKAKRLKVPQGQPIRATLVAARVERSIPITGWTNPGSDSDKAGARSTLLAVPAGTVYYFEAADKEQAQKLAEALNWHGAQNNHTLVNRRSTLLGEKGFGLGVCAAW